MTEFISWTLPGKEKYLENQQSLFAIILSISPLHALKHSFPYIRGIPKHLIRKVQTLKLVRT